MTSHFLITMTASQLNKYHRTLDNSKFRNSHPEDTGALYGTISFQHPVMYYYDR